MLSALKKKGFQIGLISNCSSEEIVSLKDCDLYDYLSVVILSCEVGAVKPDAEIYELCLSALNEQPSNCFYVGDGGSDELNGADKIGMKPLRASWFTQHFVKDFDCDKTYPIFLTPSGLEAFLCT